jgi:hypothetical protein
MATNLKSAATSSIGSVGSSTNAPVDSPTLVNTKLVPIGDRENDRGSSS